MITNYWSISPLGDAIRRLFGMPQNPQYATADVWDELRDKSLDASKFGVWLLNALDNVQYTLNLPATTYTNFVYWLSNVKNSTHTLPTTTKFGQWGDLCTKIPDALMLSVISFIEQECSHMTYAFSDDEIGEEMVKYNSQSYIRRRLFPMKIDDSKLAAAGIKWLEYQISHSATTKRDKERHPYTKIIEAYHFAKNRYIGFDVWKESGVTEFTNKHFTEGCLAFSKKPPEIQAEYMAILDKSYAIERAFNLEVTKHCTNLMKYRDYLWT